MVPNAITCVGLAFAARSIQCSLDGEFRRAAWWAMACLLTDNIDGAFARALDASSAFGAQLDSFTDFFSFGVAPVVLVYGFFHATPSAGWTDGPRATLLPIIAFAYLACVAIRLSRFNTTREEPGARRMFVGWASTYIGGMLAATFALALRYGEPAWSAGDPGSDALRVFGDARADGLMRALPWLLLPAAASMVSTLRMPRASRTGRRWVDVLLFGSMTIGYGLGLTRQCPEYLVAGGLVYLAISLRYHVVTR